MGSTPRSEPPDPPDFFLSFAGETGDTQLRACRTRGRLRVGSQDDNMLVDIDPGIRVRAGIGYADISRVILSPRHAGYTLFPIVAWPTFVHVLRILDDSILRTMQFAPDQVSPILWGTLYPTEEAARRARTAQD